jgi:putative transposase
MAEVVLNPDLLCIQKMLQSYLNAIQSTLRLTYLMLDGHFGNHIAFHIVRQCPLHLISKLHHDAAMCFPYLGPSYYSISSQR